MRVSELMEQLSKMQPNAQVMLSVLNTEETTVHAMSVELSSSFACTIRDHSITRNVHIVKLRGIEYEEVPDWKVTLNEQYGRIGR